MTTTVTVTVTRCTRCGVVKDVGVNCESASCVLARDADRALLVFARNWVLDGDLLRCRHCKRGCMSQYAHEEFGHASDCKAKKADRTDQHPWRTLKGIFQSVAVPIHSRKRKK